MLKQKNTQLDTELASAKDAHQKASEGSSSSAEELSKLVTANEALQSQNTDLEKEIEGLKRTSAAQQQWTNQRVELLRELDLLRRENGRYQHQLSEFQSKSEALHEKADNTQEDEWVTSYRGVVSRSNRKWNSLEQLINKASGRMLSISERAPKMKNQMDQLLRVMQQIQQGGRQIVETHDEFSKNLFQEDDQ